MGITFDFVEQDRTTAVQVFLYPCDIQIRANLYIGLQEETFGT
jgi:hypothetical protein